jgi:hypothetical protein
MGHPRLKQLNLDIVSPPATTSFIFCKRHL